jgi:hypothetical protein
MTKSTTRVLALFGLSVTLGPLGLMAQSPTHFTIPFDFSVGSKSFAAGDYRVAEASPDALRIQSADNRSTLMVITHRDNPGKLPGKVTMSFHRYGDTYFLYKVSNQDRGWGLSPSAREKELIAKQGARQLDVIASRK